MHPDMRPWAFLGGFALVLALAASMAAVAEDSPVQRLMGRWAGDANVVPVAGPSLPFTCVVTYIAAEGGAGMRQNLRCKTTGYRVETTTDFKIDGARVTGRWEDKINAIDGDVRGAVTANGFDVQLTGRFFAARMQVSGSACEQTVTITPEEGDLIRAITASLRKC